MGIPDPDRDAQFYRGVPVRRLTAFLIDSVVILGLWFVAVVVGFVITIFTAGLAGPLAFLLFSGTGFLYRWVMLGQRSATLGMMATGIEVRDGQGDRCTPGTAFLHTAAFYLTILFVPLLIIGWFLMASSPYRRAMHDVFLGTVVINRPA